MRQRQSGFTMIELIMVIVILGILAAIAMPRFIDLSSDAKRSAVDGVAGAAASAMAVNYAACVTVSHAATANPTKCRKIDNCDDVASVLQGGLPGDFTVGTLAIGTGVAADNGKEVSCTVSRTGTTYTAQFTAIGAGIE